MTILTNIIRFLLIFTVLVSFTSCGKDTNKVPGAYVNFSINLNDPEYQELNAPGGYVMVHGGVNGILLYRADVDNFKAYDRTCTYDVYTEGCRVSNKANHSYVECNCCGSQFWIFSGSVYKGPAQQSLREYNTSFNGSDYLTVHN